MPESTPEEVEEMYEFMDNNSWGTLEQWALETIGKPEVKEGKYSDLQGWGEKMKSAILDKANEIRRQEIGSTVQERYENYASISDKDRQYYEFYRQSFKDLQHYTTHARIIQDGFTAVDAMYESLRNFNLSLRRAEVLIPQIPTEYGRYQMRHLNRRYDLTKEVHVNRTSCAGHCLRLQRWREAHIRPLVNTTYQGRVLKGLVDKSSAPHDKLTHQLYTQFDDFGRELISAFRLLSLLNERMDKGFREEKLVRMVEGRLKRLKRMEADLNMKEWRSLNLKFIDHYKDVENACLWEEPIEMLSKQCESDDDLQREPEVQEALQKLMAFWRRKQNRRVKNADYYAKMNAIRKNWWKGKSPNIYAHNQVNVNPALTNLAMSVPEGELRDMALECARAVSFNPRYKHHEKLALVAEFCNKLKDQFFLGMGISKKEFLVLRKQAEQIARGEGDMVIDADDPMMGHEVDPSRYLPKGTSSHETKDAVNFSGKYGV
uniref:Uncharacterized protein n=1 Tax=Paramoeba aestuarina TaxID=180227 RepID=A0A7S4PG95_9EUKA